MQPRPWHAQYDAGVPTTIDYPDVPCFQFLEDAAARYPEHDCIIFKDTRISYAQANTLADRLAAGFYHELSIRKGDRVGMLLPNTPQFKLVYWALLKIGAIVVATNPAYTRQEMLFQVNDAGVSVMVTAAGRYPLVQELQAETGIARIVVTAITETLAPVTDVLAGLGDAPATELAEGDVWLSALVADFTPDQRPAVTITPDDTALFQYSGGTTGISKGVVVSHRNVVANAHQFRAWNVTGIEGQEVVLMAIPLYHAYGMVIGLIYGTIIAASFVMVPDPRDLADLLHNWTRYRASIFPGVPSIYNAINHYPGVEDLDLGSTKFCISGSTPLLRETKLRFEALTGGKLVEGYGLSETPVATHCNPVRGENRAGSIGLPLPDVDCRVVDVDDGVTDVPPGERGEFIIRGPNVMSGYHGMPEETEIHLKDGWLYTGDIGTMDAEGYFYVLDRKKEVIKPGGFQVWPREVEEVLITHPAVREVAVAGVPDGAGGEMVKAWVVLAEGGAVSADELIALCKEQLANYKAPRAVAFTDAIPKSGVGKVLRRELVRMHTEMSSTT